MTVSFLKDGTLYHPPQPEWVNIDPVFKDIVGYHLMEFLGVFIRRSKHAGDILPHHKQRMKIAIAAAEAAILHLGFSNPYRKTQSSPQDSVTVTDTEIAEDWMDEKPFSWDDVDPEVKETFYMSLIMEAKKWGKRGYLSNTAGLELVAKRYGHCCEAMHAAAKALGWSHRMLEGFSPTSN